MKTSAVCVLGWLITAVLGGQPLQIDQPLLDAIRQVESGGDLCAIGDQNLQHHAYGPYQIRMPYYQDAVQFNPSLTDGGKGFGNLWGKGSIAYSEQVIASYMGRYANANRLGHPATYEDIARIHNGGPNAWNPSSSQYRATDRYWSKVMNVLSGTGSTGKRAQPEDFDQCDPPCGAAQCCGGGVCNCLNASLGVQSCAALGVPQNSQSCLTPTLLSILAGIGITVVICI